MIFSFFLSDLPVRDLLFAEVDSLFIIALASASRNLFMLKYFVRYPSRNVLRHRAQLRKDLPNQMASVSSKFSPFSINSTLQNQSKIFKFTPSLTARLGFFDKKGGDALSVKD
jgi:hypothetical protein